MISSSGQVFPVPTGTTGPKPNANDAGKITGIRFTGGKGGENGQVSTMRIMDPTSRYPNGYVKYENSTTPRPQGVNPVTGKTDSRANTHYPIKSK